MSQFKHTYGKHTPILHVQENKLQKDLSPVKALWYYLQLRTVKDIGSFKPLFSFMDELPLSRRFFTSQLRFSLSYLGLSWEHYKSHSLRIVAATTAASMNIPEDKIQNGSLALKSLQKLYTHSYFENLAFMGTRASERWFDCV